MFTGIVQDSGKIVAIEEGDQTLVLRIEAGLVDSMQVGASVAVNGVCLTAVEVEGTTVKVEIGAETLARTSLSHLTTDGSVNLELPMSATSLFDGHIVQGHVDGVGIIRSVKSEGDSARISVEAPAELMRYIVEKGSITVDGISLTVAGVGDDSFEIAIIPHTLSVTNLGSAQAGTRVNLETDVLAKYVEKLIK